MPPHSCLLPIDKRSPLFTRVSTIFADRIGIILWIYFSLSDPSLISCHPFSSQTVNRFSYSQPACIQIASDIAWAVPYRSSLPSLSDSEDSIDQGYEIVQSAFRPERSCRPFPTVNRLLTDTILIRYELPFATPCAIPARSIWL